MKRLFVIIIVLIGFLATAVSIIHAQRYPFSFQPSYYFGQYGQPWGFQSYPLGYFPSFNGIGQNGQQWSIQPPISGYFQPLNAIPQSRSSQARLSSESSYPSMFNSAPVIPYFGSVPNNFNTFKTTGSYDLTPAYLTGSIAFASISYDPFRLNYTSPYAPINFPPGGWFSPPDNSQIFFPETGGLSPMLIQNGQLTTWEGTKDIKTITKEDEGRTITVYAGEIFRVLLSVDDYISSEDFLAAAVDDYEGYGPGWVEENRNNWQVKGFPIKPMSMGIKESEQEQENYYRALYKGEREMVFHYYSPGDEYNIKDTFKVTIRVI